MSNGSQFRIRWHFLLRLVFNVWQQFQFDQADYLSRGERSDGSMGLLSIKLRTFYKVLAVFPWVNKNNLKVQRLICAFPYHVGWHWLLSALNS